MSILKALVMITCIGSPDDSMGVCGISYTFTTDYASMRDCTRDAIAINRESARNVGVVPDYELAYCEPAMGSPKRIVQRKRDLLLDGWGTVKITAIGE